MITIPKTHHKDTHTIVQYLSNQYSEKITITYYETKNGIHHFPVYSIKNKCYDDCRYFRVIAETKTHITIKDCEREALGL